MNRSQPNTLDAWRGHFESAFPEIAALLRERGVGFHIENSAAGGLCLIIEHRTERRFGVSMTPSEMRGLRGLKYSIRDDAKPSDNRAFVAELKRRLATVGASYEDVYFQRPGFLERPKLGRPRGPLSIARDAY